MNGARKPPAWAMVVGILGVCFGALGLLGGTYELMMPMMMSMQKQMMEGMRTSMKEAPRQRQDCPPGSSAKSSSSASAHPDAAFEAMEKFMSYPEWYGRFALANGGLQLVLAALYVLASILLLLVKRGAAVFFLSVAAISAVRNLVGAGIGIYAGSFLAFWSVASGVVGFLIDLVLIVVVLISDRSVYARAQAT